MKKLITVLIVFILIAACVLGFFAYERDSESKTNDEIISQTDLFDVSGNELAIIYDFSLQSVKGIYRNDQAYLPLSWVRDYINDKFYWDKSIETIIYTLPEDIEFFRLSEENYTQSPRYVIEKDEPYLSLDFISSRSSIYCSSYLGDIAKRVYINDFRDAYDTAVLTRDAMLRTGESELQRGIIPLSGGDSVRIIKHGSNGWSRILTQTGFPGYVKTEYLGNRKTEEPVFNYSAPVYSHILMEDEIIMAWNQLENMSSNENLPALYDRTSGLNVISPTWFSVLDNNGSIKSLASHDYVSFAHKNGLKVWGLVNNFSTNVNSTELLSSWNSRSNLISQLISEAKEYELDGINVDFEQLEEKCGPHFVEFIRELSVSCRKEGLVLSIDNPNMQPFNIFYGRDAQAECADYVINMGYDEHFSGGDAGSVASLPFVDTGLQACLSQVPANQLICGIPFYTRIWNLDGADVSSQAVGIETAQQWVEDHGVTLIWDENLGQNYGQSENHYIWMEDSDSLKAKINLSRSYNLAGFAGWKLGMEAPETWNLFKKQ